MDDLNLASELLFSCFTPESFQTSAVYYHKILPLHRYFFAIIKSHFQPSRYSIKRFTNPLILVSIKIHKIHAVDCLYAF